MEENKLNTINRFEERQSSPLNEALNRLLSIHEEPQSRALFSIRDTPDNCSQSNENNDKPPSVYRLRSRVSHRFAPSSIKGLKSCGIQLQNREYSGALIGEKNLKGTKRVRAEGFKNCSSPFCPFCEWKMREDKAELLSYALKRANRLGYKTKFITLTAPSTSSNGSPLSIDFQYEHLKKAFSTWRGSIQTQAKRKNKEAFTGFSYSYDATFKKKNGVYHTNLHLHLIMATDSEEEFSQDNLHARWVKAYRGARGNKRLHLWKKACWVEEVKSDNIADYIYKYLGASEETLGSTGKQHSSPNSFTIRDLIEKLAVWSPEPALIALYKTLTITFYKMTWSSLGSLKPLGVVEKEKMEEEKNKSPFEEDEEFVEVVRASISEESSKAIHSIDGCYEFLIDNLFEIADLIDIQNDETAYLIRQHHRNPTQMCDDFTIAQQSWLKFYQEQSQIKIIRDTADIKTLS